MKIFQILLDKLINLSLEEKLYIAGAIIYVLSVVLNWSIFVLCFSFLLFLIGFIIGVMPTVLKLWKSKFGKTLVGILISIINLTTYLYQKYYLGRYLQIQSVCLRKILNLLYK